VYSVGGRVYVFIRLQVQRLPWTLARETREREGKRRDISGGFFSFVFISFVRDETLLERH
jgi:hypothetical protein